MKRSFGGWLSPKKKRMKVCRPLALLTSPRHTACLSQCWKREPQFVGWEKVLHPSQPVVAARDIPRPTGTPRQKVGSSQIFQMIPIKPPVSPPRASTPPQPSPSTQALVLVQLPTPPSSFSGVMACLHAPELVEVDLEAPVGMMSIGLLVTPGISSVSSSIVKDELTVVTYMEHSHDLCWEGDHHWSRSRSLSHRSYNRGHHGLPIGSLLKSVAGQMNGHSPYGAKQNIPDTSH